MSTNQRVLDASFEIVDEDWALGHSRTMDIEQDYRSKDKRVQFESSSCSATASTKIKVSLHVVVELDRARDRDLLMEFPINTEIGTTATGTSVASVGQLEQEALERMRMKREECEEIVTRSKIDGFGKMLELRSDKLLEDEKEYEMRITLKRRATLDDDPRRPHSVPLSFLLLLLFIIILFGALTFLLGTLHPEIAQKMDEALHGKLYNKKEIIIILCGAAAWIVSIMLAIIFAIGQVPMANRESLDEQSDKDLLLLELEETDEIEKELELEELKRREEKECQKKMDAIMYENSLEKLLICYRKECPEDLNSLFVRVVKECNLTMAIVSKLLDEEGVDVNKVDEGGNSMLHIAVEKGNLEMVKVLTERGADLQSTNHLGHYPLHLAAMCMESKIVNFLIEKGANLEAKDNHGFTPLYLAALNGCNENIKILLNNGANLEAKDNEGMRPVHAAILLGVVSTLSILLDKGADIISVNKRGSTTLHWAVFRSTLAVVQTLLAQPPEKFGEGGREAHVNARCKFFGNTALHIAYYRKDKAIIECLEKNGADGSIKNNMGFVPNQKQHSFLILY